LISWIFEETGEFVLLFLILAAFAILAVLTAAFLPVDSEQKVPRD
jgi:hypothetical protein